MNGSGWISVEERLPPRCQMDVLVYTKGIFRYDMKIYFGKNKGGWGDGCNKGQPYEVTHWMPLPEPPKEE